MLPVLIATLLTTTAAVTPVPRVRIHDMMNRAIGLSEANRHEESIGAFIDAINEATDASAWVSESFDAWLAYEELAARGWFNLGAVLNTARRAEESLEAFAHAISGAERATRERQVKLRSLAVSISASHTVRLLQFAEYAVSARMHIAGRRDTDEAVALLHAAGGAAIAALSALEAPADGDGGIVPPMPSADTHVGSEWRRLATALRTYGAQALFNAAALLTNERERHGEALATLRVALALQPAEVQRSGRSEVLVRTASLLYFGNRVMDADAAAAVEADADTDADASPASPASCGDVVELGHALAGAGRYREARAAYARALAAGPALADAHYGAGAVELHGYGDGDAARRHLARAVALDPTHGAARIDRGLAEAEPRVRSVGNDGTRFPPSFPFGDQYYAPEAVEARFEEVAPGLVRVSNALTEAQLRTLAAALSRVEEDPAYARMVNTSRAFGDAAAYDVGGHAVTYVHDFLPPALFWRLRGLALRADLAAGWGLADEIPPWRWNARCVESLVYTPSSDEYSAKGGGSIGWHDDSGSFMNIMVGISDLAGYGGGAFEIKRDNDPWTGSGRRHNLIGDSGDSTRSGDSDGGKVAYTIRVDHGDMVVFTSWRRHRVTPVTHGRRHVLVVELWDALPRRGHDGGPERPAPHPGLVTKQARAIDRVYGPGRLGPRSQDASWRDGLYNLKEQSILRAESEFDRRWFDHPLLVTGNGGPVNC